MEMFNPPHPGGILKDDVLPAKGLSVSAAATEIGISRSALSRFINQQSALSIEMALKIEKWLGKNQGGSAESWLRMQLVYDLWQARHPGKEGRCKSGTK